MVFSWRGAAGGRNGSVSTGDSPVNWRMQRAVRGTSGVTASKVRSTRNLPECPSKTAPKWAYSAVGWACDSVVNNSVIRYTSAFTKHHTFAVYVPVPKQNQKGDVHVDSSR